MVVLLIANELSVHKQLACRHQGALGTAAAAGEHIHPAVMRA